MVDPALTAGIKPAQALEKAAGDASGPPIGDAEVETFQLSPETLAYITQATGGPIGEFGPNSVLVVRFRRFKRGVRRVERASAILRERGREQARRVPDDVIVPLLEAGSLTEDETLTERWAALLANAMDPATAPVRPNFADILSHLTSTDVQVLEYVASLAPKPGLTWLNASRHTIEIAGPVRDKNALAPSLDSLLRERLLVEIEERRRPRIDARTNQFRDEPPRGYKLRFTKLGAAFVTACRTQIADDAADD